MEKEIEKALQNKRQVNTLQSALTRMRDKRRKRMLRFRPEELNELKRIREGNRRNILENIERLREAVEKAGGRFVFASDAEEAQSYVLSVVKESGARLVIKSKSLTTEEVGLNEALEELGVEVVETDLGERIVQLAGERPSHILAPAVHKDAYEIASILSPNLSPDPTEITRYVRKELREKFLTAGVGISGANVIASDVGAVFIVTNEGNERFVTSIPRVYICVAGVEKVVSNIEEALKIIRILVPSATGQLMSSYVTVVSPYMREFRDGREFHMVLVDNGRLEALGGGELEETLECIRCSACFNVCPTYRLVGGHVFGHIYSGPIGLTWTAIAHGYHNAFKFSSLCISCGLCKVECPVDIDIPMMISRVKDWGNRYVRASAPYLLRNYDKLLRLGSRFPKLSNILLSSGLGKRLMSLLADTDMRRNMPLFADENFYKKFSRITQDGEYDRRAVLFTDYLIMYMFPEIGVKAVKLLNKAGTYCLLPKQLSSGMPLIQYGYLKEAEKIARSNVENLFGFVREGYDVICLEPTAWYCLKEVYPKLLGDSKAERLADSVYSLAEYLLEYCSEVNRGLEYIHVAYHWPCHARGKWIEEPFFKRLLERAGYRVSLVDEGCCGMAGTWGMRRGYKGYEISVEIGRNLVERMKETNAEALTTDSTVCMIQLKTFSPEKTLHSLDLLT